MRVEFDKKADDPQTDAAPTMTPAGTNDLNPGNANALQDAWINHVNANGQDPFYAFDGSGKLWRIGPDNMGAGVTATPLVPQYVISDTLPSKVYMGADAWDKLYESMGYAFELPTKMKSAFNSIRSSWYMSKAMVLCAKVFDQLRATLLG